MKQYTISKNFGWHGEITDKAAAVMRMFGLTKNRLNDSSLTHKCSLTIKQGDIVYLTGPSGAGKSVLLRELQKKFEKKDCVNLDDIKLSKEKTVIDCINGKFIDSLRFLSTAGLADAFCVLNKPALLSEGQKYRFRLAKAITEGKKTIFADEFCSNLDRVTAAVISYNIHKFAVQNKVTFILASGRDDIMADLEPNVLVIKDLSGETEVIYKTAR